jgi:hypothetical protein
VESCLLDEPTKHDQRRGQEEIELDHHQPLLGTAPQLPLAIHPAMRPLHRPPTPCLARCWHPLPGDGSLEAQLIEQGTRGAARIALVQVKGPRRGVGDRCYLLQTSEGRLQHGRIMAIGIGRDQMERDTGTLRQDRAFQLFKVN